MKTITNIMVNVLIGVAIGLFAAEASAEKKIGVLLWNDQPRYEENLKGFMEQLNKEGYREPAVKFSVEHAGGNKGKAAELAKKFGDAKMDMVVGVGTSAAVAVAKEIKDVPVVFIMVWDPVESKIAMDWKSSGNNTTGVSSKTPAAKLFSALREIAPVKRVGVLYTAGERNSEIQLKEFEAVKNDFNIKVVPVPLNSKESAAAVLPEVMGAVEAVCLTGSSVVGDSLPTIVDIAAKAKVITASQSEDHVERGVLMGITVDPYAVGGLAGEKAAKVLKGAKPASIPIEPLKKNDVVVNLKTAKASQVKLPEGFMKTVTNKIQ